MKCNVGKKEKIVRTILGVVALALGVVVSPWFYVVAAIAFITAIIGFCPVSHLLSINTCETEDTTEPQEAA